jgi:DNA-binding MarR family transcriptional regulator
MTDLAARLDRSPSTTTRFVDRAARQGLVSRETGEDRRQRLVRLTPAGLTSRERLQALRRARTEALPHEVRARTGLGTAEVLWLLDALVEAVRGSGTPATGGD